MLVTKELVYNKLSSYLKHQLSITELVNWAETAFMEDEFDSEDYDIINDIISKLGVADAANFGLTWDDCEEFFKKLGYSIRLEFELAS